MITWEDFEAAVNACLPTTLNKRGNPEQHEAISALMPQSLFLVAGPGSGKTTVIALRVLKLIYVDGEKPKSIVVTTFTKKAAAELRSRILGWGDALRKGLLKLPDMAPQHGAIEALDFNLITVGTLDSISEALLTRARQPGAPSPVLVEEFVARAVMVEYGLFDGGRHLNVELASYIQGISGRAPRFVDKVAFLTSMKDRIIHDRVDAASHASKATHPGVPVAHAAVQGYEKGLNEMNLYDFARLEEEFLQQLPTPNLAAFLAETRHIFVDEYQDTNYLQELIYFAVAKACVANGGSFVVVGDDDQALYRFRGATVELFADFAKRVPSTIVVKPIALSRNYRSTSAIVDFYNAFAILDPKYQAARVIGKSATIAARKPGYTPYPVMGLFRNDVQDLARDLSDLIHSVVRGNGVQLPAPYDDLVLKVHPNGGSSADVALLASSTQEAASSGDPRLPRLLRDRLAAKTPPIKVFNPRGQDLEEVPAVQRLLGLLLIAIDPDATVQGSIKKLPQDAIKSFTAWRAAGNKLLATAAPGPRGAKLAPFITHWQQRKWKKPGRVEVPLADLIYNLVTWVPEMQTDIEGTVHLEAVTRTITQAGLFTSFGGNFVSDPKNPDLEALSVKEAIRKILTPLATGAIDVNEDLLDTLPRDRLNIMSVHQAKGLEFPLVIVDVGSDFKTRHASQAFKRFPATGSPATNLEDEFRPHTQLQLPNRSTLDRAFDDLIRQSFVAFSRPQDALLLVGLRSVSEGYMIKTKKEKQKIPNIASGWDRDENWVWKSGLKNLVHL